MPNPEIGRDTKKLVLVILNAIRWIFIGFFIYSFISLISSVKDNYPLWISPLHAEGRIVGHETRYTDDFGAATYPIVEFQNSSNVTIRFTDYFSDSSNSTIRFTDYFADSSLVPVIYSSHNPNDAKINHGLINWIETYAWLFATFCGLFGMVRFSKENIAIMFKKAIIIMKL